MLKNKQVDFRFYTDELSIIKAKDDNGNKVMKIGGIASREERDQQGEVLVVDGMDVQDMVWGFLNWNHLGSKDPSTVIGQIIKAEKRNKELYIEAELFNESKMARDVYRLTEILEKRNSPRKMQFSVEGKAIERDNFDQGRVVKSKITGCAATVNPINRATFAQIIKGETNGLEEPIYQEPEPNINKSHNGGDEAYILDIIDEDGNRVTVNKDFQIKITKATTTTTASAVIPESLDGDLKNLDKRKKKFEKSFFINNKNDNFSQNLEKSQIYDHFFQAIPDISLGNAKRLYDTTVAIKKAQGNTMPETITNEDLSKAFEALGIKTSTETNDITKGMDLPDAKTQGGNTAIIEKMCSMMKNYGEKGMSKEDMFKAMKENEDIDTDDESMEEAYKQAFEKNKNMKKGEGTIDDQLAKAEAALADLKKKKEDTLIKSGFTEGNNKDNNELIDLIKSMKSDFDSQFAHVGTILKKVVGENELLKSEKATKEDELKEAEENLKKAQESYNALANDVSKPKSITTQNFIQKGEAQGQSKIPTLSVSQQRKDVLQKGEEFIDWNLIEAGDATEGAFAKGLDSIQFGGTIPQSVINRFKERGVTLVN